MRTDAAAPARADDADINLFHFANLLLTVDRRFRQAAARPRPTAKRVLLSLSLEHRGLRGTNRDLLC
jgi:hypothetical protein